MGNSISQAFSDQDDFAQYGKPVLMHAKQLGIKRKEIRRLHYDFLKLGPDFIDVNELCMLTGVKHSIFGEFILRQYDRSGKFTFLFYMLSLWSLLTCTDDLLASYCFSMVDVDRSNTLHVTEVKLLLNAIWDFVPPKEVDLAAGQFERNIDGIVTIAEFVLLSRHCPYLFAPVVKFRDMLRKSVVYWAWWLRLTNRRVKLFKSQSPFDITDLPDKEFIKESVQQLYQHPAAPPNLIQEWRSVLLIKPAIEQPSDLPFEIRPDYQPPDLPIARRRRKKVKNKSRRMSSSTAQSESSEPEEEDGDYMSLEALSKSAGGSPGSAAGKPLKPIYFNDSVLLKDSYFRDTSWLAPPGDATLVAQPSVQQQQQRSPTPFSVQPPSVSQQLHSPPHPQGPPLMRMRIKDIANLASRQLFGSEPLSVNDKGLTAEPKNQPEIEAAVVAASMTSLTAAFMEIADGHQEIDQQNLVAVVESAVAPSNSQLTPEHPPWGPEGLLSNVGAAEQDDDEAGTVSSATKSRTRPLSHSGPVQANFAPPLCPRPVPPLPRLSTKSLKMNPHIVISHARPAGPTLSSLSSMSDKVDTRLYAPNVAPPGLSSSVVVSFPCGAPSIDPPPAGQPPSSPTGVSTPRSARKYLSALRSYSPVHPTD